MMAGIMSLIQCIYVDLSTKRERSQGRYTRITCIAHAYTMPLVCTVGYPPPKASRAICISKLRSRCAPKSEATARPAAVHVARTRSL